MKDLIEQYLELAQKHGEYTLNGDSINGNKIHSKMMKVIAQIKSKPKEIHKLFYKTIEHENDSVKMWTATALLKTNENESIKTLKQVAKTSKTIHGLTAKTTLDCWKKGMLTDITNWNE